MRTPIVFLGAGLLLLVANLEAKDSGGKYIIPSYTLSPGEKYGVKVPVFSFDDKGSDPRSNQIVDLASGKTVAVIEGDDPAYNRTLNHHGTGEATWSKDESLLLWNVPGKWHPDMLVMVKLEKGKEKWQLDLLKAAQQAALRHTKKAAPDRYEAAKKENGGGTSYYPDGFTIDVTPVVEEGKPLSLPLTVRVDLTANPKGIEDFKANLDSQLEGAVGEDGVFVVKSFYLGKAP